MEYRRTLLTSASFIALAASVPGPSQAALTPSAPPAVSVVAPVEAVQPGDPLFTFIVETRGSYAPASVRAATLAVFPQIGPAQLGELPRFLSNLAALGVPSDGLAAAREALFERLDQADIDEAARETAVAALSGPGVPQPYRVAQLGALLDGFCDPLLEEEDPDCADPLVAGAINNQGGVPGGQYRQ